MGSRFRKPLRHTHPTRDEAPGPGRDTGAIGARLCAIKKPSVVILTEGLTDCNPEAHSPYVRLKSVHPSSTGTSSRLPNGSPRCLTCMQPIRAFRSKAYSWQSNDRSVLLTWEHVDRRLNESHDAVLSDPEA